MDLRSVRSELQKLAGIIDSWKDAQEIPALERELVLEKLRRVYDKVRFEDGKGAAVEDSAEGGPVLTEITVGIDPLEVLPVEALVEEPQEEPVPAEPEVVAEQTPAEQIPSQESIAAGRIETAVPEDAGAASQDTPESTPVEQEGDMAATASGPEPLPGDEVTPQVETASAEQVEPQAETASQPMTSTLFGVEVESSGHRHKQRVIMSLYNSDISQVPATKPAAPAENEPGTETPAVSQPGRPWQPQASALPQQDSVHEPVTESLTQLGPELTGATTTIDNDEDLEEITVQASGPADAVLGEVIGHDVQTLGDTIAAPRDIASELRSQEPVTDLRYAIGINDKFLMIRDLFGGDAAAYNAAIDSLNAFDDLDDCMIHIAENYAWNANSDGAKFLMELLERKLG